jgi:hypothetical protein
MSKDKDKEAKGRAKGGKARAEKLSPERRKEISLKGVEAKKINATLPQATHAGEIKIGEVTLACYVLDDGSRVLSLRGINAAFGMSEGGRREKAQDGARNLPRILSSKTIKSLISSDFMERLLEQKEFKPMHGGRSAFGYDAALLPEICEVIIDAHKAGATRIDRAATIAETLLRGFARVGIVALVDEATGYEKDRVAGSLAKILEAFIAKELQPWVKTFPADYYEQLFRIYNLPYPPAGNKGWRPSFFGKITNDVIYDRLAPDLLPELKKAASKAEKKSKLHQWLTNDIGHPKLREHLASIVTILKLSRTPQEFKENVDRIHTRYGYTHQIPFDYQSED